MSRVSVPCVLAQQGCLVTNLARWARICCTAFRKKFDRLTDFQFTFVKRTQGPQMIVVTDQMGRPPIDGAQQKHHIVRVNWVVAKMEKRNSNQFCVNCEGCEKRLHL